MKYLNRMVPIAFAACALFCSPSWATPYLQTNLVSDIPGLAQLTDASLHNPWGMSFSATSPFWVSDQATGQATLYSVINGVVTKQGLVVTIPGSGVPQGPTGQVNNNTSMFLVNGVKANFIFANLDGSISAWNGSAGTTAVVKVPTTGAIYTGLALGNGLLAPRLYAANAISGHIDVFDGSFGSVNLGAGAFAKPAAVAAGLTPFNVQNIGGRIYVTYAPATRAAQIVASEGSGAVVVFDSDGNFIQTLVSGSKLASPWGLTTAPSGFGGFGGDLLVGNFSFAVSEINAFDPITGAYVGTISDKNGNALINAGLWGLAFGNGGSGGNANTLYFSAGINGEADGLFGAISVIPEPETLALFALGLIVLTLRSPRRQERVV